MLRPQDNRPARPDASTGCGTSSLDPDGVGRDEGWWRARSATRGRCPCPRAYNDVLVEPAGARPRRRRLVPARRPRAPRAGTAGASSCASTPPRHRAVVWVDDEQVAEHEGGYTPVRGRRHRTRPCPARHCGSPSWSTTSSPGTSIPPGSSTTCPTAAASSSLLPRLLQLRRAASAASGCAPPRRPTSTTHGGDRSRRRRPASSAASTVVAGRGHRRPGRRSGTPAAGSWPRVRATRVSCGSPTPTLWEPGPRLPLRPAGRRHATATSSSTATRQPVGIRTVRVDGTRFLINGEPFYFQRLRHARGPQRPGPGPRRRLRWSTTSRSWPGSAPTPSAPRTTPTPRRSSTTPTGSASWSSTRPPPSA